MYLVVFFIPAALLLFLLFLPDLFPRCSCCGKLKARPLIRIHKAVSFNPGYRGYRSVCRKCCRKYEIQDIYDLERLNGIRRRIRLEALKKDIGL